MSKIAELQAQRDKLDRQIEAEELAEQKRGMEKDKRFGELKKLHEEFNKQKKSIKIKVPLEITFDIDDYYDGVFRIKSEDKFINNQLLSLLGESICDDVLKIPQVKENLDDTHRLYKKIESIVWRLSQKFNLSEEELWSWD